jgi:hypothetical protein
MDATQIAPFGNLPKNQSWFDIEGAHELLVQLAVGLLPSPSDPGSVDNRAMSGLRPTSVSLKSPFVLPPSKTLPYAATKPLAVTSVTHHCDERHNDAAFERGRSRNRRHRPRLESGEDTEA